jgi:hypothetical protein
VGDLDLVKNIAIPHAANNQRFAVHIFDHLVRDELRKEGFTLVTQIFELANEVLSVLVEELVERSAFFVKLFIILIPDLF